MGSGSWSASTYDSAAKMRKATGTATFAHTAAMRSAPASARKVHDLLDPKKVAGPDSPFAGKIMREARDSDEHPNSLPIVVCFDETGSMGQIPEVLQTKLPDLFGLLLRKGYVEDPQILMSAVGDATNGTEIAPWQIGQFESDNRIDATLEAIYLEGNGGGGNHESYADVAWFLANKTATDAWDKRGKQGYCNTPDAPIWMADQTFQPIGKLEPGDEVMGWVHTNGRRSLVATVVEGVQHRLADNVVRVTMESGRIITCTADHNWLSGHHGASGKDLWTNIRNRFGRPALLSHVIDPVKELPPGLWEDAAWLAGIYDGEGSGYEITQSRTHNPEVCARIERVLNNLGFQWIYRDKDGGKCGSYFILGGIQAYVEMLNWLPITKRDALLSKVLSSKWARYRHGEERPLSMTRRPDRVVDIVALPPQEVVSLQTGTHNYVAWGYASSNCFFIGDERLYRKVRADAINRMVDEKLEEDLDTVDVFTALKERYHVYFLFCSQASYRSEDVLDESPRNSSDGALGWRTVLSENAITLDDAAAVCETIALTIGINEGTIDLDTGLVHLDEIGSTVGKSVGKALAKVGAGAGGGAIVTAEGPGDLDVASDSGITRL